MAELEQAAHFALKAMPSDALAWVLPDLIPDLAFRRWLDTNLIAFPGEPGRRCDTVAELISKSGTTPPWAVVLEVEARPRYSFLGRAWEYAARLWRKLRHGPRRRDRYLVAAVVLFLSGRRKDLQFAMALPGTNVGFSGTIRAMRLRLQQAPAVLARIDCGELGRSILFWVPLMAGAGHGTIWKQALEAFNVRQLEIVREWKDEARVEERQTALLTTLRVRFPPSTPEDLTRLIQETTDLSLLSRWFVASLEAPSLDAFRHRIQQSPSGTP